MFLAQGTRQCAVGSADLPTLAGWSTRNWRKSENLSQNPKSLRSAVGPVQAPDAAAPTARIATDRVRDLELCEREVSKQTACQSVLPLALRTGRTVDADGERRSNNCKVDDGQLFTDGDDGAASAHDWTRSRTLVSASEPPCYLPTLTTITCARHGARVCCSSTSLVMRVPQDCF